MLSIVLALLLSCEASGTPAKPKTWVTDYAGVLSPITKRKLEARLRNYRDEKGPDVVVWIVKEMPEEPRETWCFKTFNSWGIGDAYRHDGVVLFVFAHGPKYCWITTGAGLVQDLTNAEAVRICREIVAPEIRRGKPEEAVVSGVKHIISALEN